MFRTAAVSLALLAFATVATPPASAQFNSLVRRVPSDANSIVFVDVQALMATPLAQKEGWAADAQKAFQAGLLVIPPNTDRFVASSRIDLHSMNVTSHTFIFDMGVEPNIVNIATRFNGTVDNINGHEAAVLPGDYFVVKFTPRFIVLGSPARRQDVVYYVRRVDNNSMQLSEYLREADGFARNGAPIIMALDMSDSMPRDYIRARLETSEALKDKGIDLDAAADALATVRGMMLGVTVEEAMTGSIKIDFNQDVSFLGDAAKPLFLEALSKRGLMIDEINDWDLKISGKSVQLIGKLEDSGLRRIMSLLPVPPPLHQAAEQVAQLPQEQVDQKAALAASLNYFQSVDSLLADLRNDKRNRQTLGQVAGWFEKYADRIDRLPSLNVDPYLLDYGTFVSRSLRGGGGAVRESMVDSTIRQQQVPQQYDFRSWWEPIGVVSNGWWGGGGASMYGWGGWEATPNVRATGQIQSQVRMQGAAQTGMTANAVMQSIDQATGEIRRAMTQKFQVQF